MSRVSEQQAPGSAGRPTVEENRDHTLAVLCIDIEGGHGGSSRSLFQTLEHIDRSKASLTVWHRLPGEIERLYGDIGIETVHAPDMPRLTTLDRESRNALNVARFFLNVWPGSKGFRERLLKALDEADLVHLNHISLFWLGRWIKRQRPTLPVTMHIRTRPYRTSVGFWQQRVAARYCDGLVHITENERDHFVGAAGCEPKGTVLYNPVSVRDASRTETDIQLPERRFIASVLSNYSYYRGLDRLIDVAKRLDDFGDESVTFVVGGDMKISGHRSGKLAALARAGRTLEDYARDEGVAGRFMFLGHIKDPERLLLRSDVLLKPTREDNPWGRDILEALAHGVPVASVGAYNVFVETGQTGLLQPSFDAGALAEWLISLSQNPDERLRLSGNARTRVRTLCDPKTQADSLLAFWRDVASGNK